MPKLVLKKNLEIIDEFTFKKSKLIYLIGSDEQNDFVIHDEKVAIKHLKIECIQNSWYVEDLNTKSGTSLNGKPMLNKEQIVQSDELAIGKHHLIFENLAADSLDDSETYFNMSEGDIKIDIIGEDDFADVYNKPEEKPVESFKPTEQAFELNSQETSEFYQFEDLAPETATIESNSNSQNQTSSKDASPFSLLAIYGPYIGNKYPLKYGETKIGRDNTLNDIIIRNDESGILDPSISRRHATVNYKNGKFYVSDKRSKTRTFVNQVKLGEAEDYPANEGDEIEIVSDQKSTIFRIVRNEHEVLKPPQKAGIWWIRNSNKLGLGLSLLFAAIALFAISGALKTHFLLNKTIEKLSFLEEIWYLDEGLNQTQNITGAQNLNLAVADLNGDGKLNVIFSNSFGNIQVLDGGSKKELWQNTQIQVMPGSAISLADLNQNGLPDIILACTDMRMRALDGSNGAEIWLSPLLGEAIVSTPVIDDFNNDNIQDILITNRAGQITIGYGNVLAVNWQNIETGLELNSVPTAYDWNDDGAVEIFAGSKNGKLLVISGKNGELDKVYDFKDIAGTEDKGDFEINREIFAPIAIARLEDSEKVNLIFSTTQGEFLGVDAASFNKLFYEKLHHKHNLGTLTFSPAIGDISGSGQSNAALISNQMLKVIDLETKKTDWEYFVADNDYFISPTVLADFNKDKAADVIASSISGTIFIFDGRNGKIIERIQNDQNPVTSPLLVADLGADGLLDMIYRRKDGHIYKIQTNSTISQSGVVWGQRFGNASNTCELTYKPEGLTSTLLVATFSGLLFFIVGGFTHSASSKRIKKMQESIRG